VFPQENGNRRQVRWARLSGIDGGGLVITGMPCFDLTARRWSNAALDAATHADQLEPDGKVHLNLDIGQHGIGSASTGPELPDRYQLPPAPATFTIGLAAFLPDHPAALRGATPT
jgi:beta-galactosidase